ncbi:PAS domain-containing protein [Plasmodiophora brassicae]
MGLRSVSSAESSTAQSFVSGAAVADDLDFSLGQDGTQNTSLAERLVIWFNSCQAGFIALLYIMSKSSSHSAAYDVVVEIIEAFQMMALMVPPADAFNFGLERPIQSWFDFALYFTVLPRVVLGDKAVEIGNYLSAGLLMILLATGTYLGYACVAGSNRYMWIAVVFRSLAGAMVTFMYVPTFGILTWYVTFEDLPIWANTFITVLMLALAPVIAVVGAVIALTMFESEPTSTAASARPHSRIFQLRFAMKTILTVIGQYLWWTPIAQTDACRICWALLTLASAFTLAYLQVMYQPFYNMKSNMLHAVFQSVVFWAVLCSTFLRVILPRTVSVMTLFFGGPLFVVPLVILAVKTRRSYLDRLDVAKCSNVYEVELCCRPADWRNATDSELDAIAGKYQQAHERFPKSVALHIFESIFLLSVRNATLQARKVLLRADKLELSVDEKFYLFRQVRKLKECMESWTTGKDRTALEFVNLERGLLEARRLDMKCCQTMVQFWIEIDKKSDMNRVLRLTQAIGFLTNRASAAYRTLVRRSPNSPKALHMYAGFLHTVINNTDLADRMSIKAERAVNLRRQEGGTQNDYMDEQVATVTISITDDTSNNFSLGSIIAVNDPAVTLLGDGVVGRDLHQFLLPPWSTVFPTVATRYLDSGETDLMMRPINAFCKNAKGELFQGTIFLRPFSHDGITFVTFASIVPTSSPLASIVIADSSTGLVFGMSAAALSLFQVGVDDLASNSLKVTDLIQDYDDNREEFLRDPGVAREAAMSHRVSLDDPGRINVAVTLFQVHTETVDAITVSPFDEPRHSVAFSSSKVSIALPPVDSVSEVSDSERDLTSLAVIAPEQTSGNRSRRRFFGQSSRKVQFTALQDTPDGTNTACVDLVAESKMDVAGKANTGSGRARVRNSNVGPPSASSVSEANSSVNQARALRHALLRNNSELDPSLRSFRNIYLRVIALVAVASTAWFVAEHQSVTTYNSFMQTAIASSNRRAYLTSAAFAAFNLMLMNNGLIPNDTDVQALLRERMSGAAATLHSNDLALYKARGLFGGDVVPLYETPAVKVRLLLQDSDNSHGTSTMVSQMGLFDAVTMYTSAADQLTRSDLSKFRSTDPLVFTLIANALGSTPSSLPGAITASRDAVFAKLTSLLSSTVSMTVIVSVICLVLITISVLALYPKVKTIEESKHETMQTLMNLPEEATAAIRDSILDRLETTHGIAARSVLMATNATRSGHNRSKTKRRRPQNDSGDLTLKPADEDDDQRNDNDQRCEDSPTADARSQPRDAGTGGDLQIGTTPASNMTADQGTMNVKHADSISIADQRLGKQTFQTRLGKMLMALDHFLDFLQDRGTHVTLRAATIILVAMVYFIAANLQVTSMHDSMRNLPAWMSLSSSNHRLTADIALYLQMYAAGAKVKGVDDDVPANLITQPLIMNSILQLETSASQLLYSNENRGTVGMVNVYGGTQPDSVSDELDLLLTNGCIHFQEGASPTQVTCEQFRNGVMASGLYHATVEYARQSKGLANVLSNTAPAANADIQVEGATGTGIWLLGNETAVMSNLATADLVNLLEFENSFMDPVGRRSLKLFGNVVGAILPDYVLTQILLLVGFIAAVVAQYLFVVYPLIGVLDSECKQARMLLLLVPEESLAGIASSHLFTNIVNTDEQCQANSAEKNDKAPVTNN